MSAIFKFLLCGAYQSQPRLMHQFGALQGFAGRFPGHLAGGQPTQFLVNENQQLFGCCWLALLYSTRQDRGVAHGLTFENSTVYEGGTEISE
jgi:hypothetical protein